MGGAKFEEIRKFLVVLLQKLQGSESLARNQLQLEQE